jgi:hypothetical protein
MTKLFFALALFSSFQAHAIEGKKLYAECGQVSPAGEGMDAEYALWTTDESNVYVIARVALNGYHAFDAIRLDGRADARNFYTGKIYTLKLARSLGSARYVGATITDSNRNGAARKVSCALL